MDNHKLPGSVLFAIDELDTGGTERQLTLWVRGLRKRGVPVHIVALRSGGRTADLLCAEGVDVHVLHKRGAVDFQFLVRQQRLLNRIRPSVVVALLTTAGVWTVPAARLAGVPRVIYSGRNTRLTNDNERPGPKRIMSLALKAAHMVIGNSQAVVQFHADTLRVSPKRLITLPNAVDCAKERNTARVSLRREFGLPIETPLFGIVARLAEIKNHELFLDAAERLFQRHPLAQGVIVGHGPRANWLRNEIRRRGFESRLRMLGHQRRSAAVIRALDVLVLTSHHEGSPNVVLESLAVGTPVVSVPVGDVEEILDPQTGSVVTSGDPSDIADAVSDWLRRECNQTESRLERHSPEQVVNQFHEILFTTASQPVTQKLL
jgi:glycosyltransferase involved in cell wall biosynthesis